MIKITPPQRTTDEHGSGAWHASRIGRLHEGVDVACWPGSVVLSSTVGIVSKIGLPYYSETDTSKNHFRYVEVKTPLGYKIRYMYVEPTVTKGDCISVDQALGSAQDLTKVYKDITPHVHIGVKNPQGEYINPETYFGER